MKKILTFAFLALGIGFSHAQPRGEKLLQDMLAKVKQLKSLSYNNSTVTKNMFSEGDTSTYHIASDMILNNGRVKSHNQVTETGKAKFRDIFNNDTLYQVDLNDSTYTIKAKPEQSDIPSAIFNVFEIVKRNLGQQPSVISQKTDTLINRKKYYSILIKQYDKVENGYHNYTFFHIAIDKTTMMPVLFRENGAGIAEKDGHVIGRITAYNNVRFSNYRFNKSIDQKTFYFDKNKFSLPNSQMLTDGTTAPLLKLTTTNGLAAEKDQFKNKVHLVEFGATDCGANALANPMLNRLFEKYHSAGVAITYVLTGETPVQAGNYIKSNGIKFPVCFTDLKTKKSFKTIGTPGFYLLDKNGIVLMSSNGYSDELESQLSAKIDAALKNN